MNEAYVKFEMITEAAGGATIMAIIMLVSPTGWRLCHRERRSEI